MESLKTIAAFKEYLNSLPPMEVEKFIFDIFKTSNKFTEVELSPIINERQIDITLTEKQDSPIGKVEAFKSALSRIEPGKTNWSKYQSLVVDMLEFLLCPPLGAPEVEL